MYDVNEMGVFNDEDENDSLSYESLVNDIRDLLDNGVTEDEVRGMFESRLTPKAIEVLLTAAQDDEEDGEDDDDETTSGDNETNSESSDDTPHDTEAAVDAMTDIADEEGSGDEIDAAGKAARDEKYRKQADDTFNNIIGAISEHRYS